MLGIALRCLTTIIAIAAVPACASAQARQGDWIYDVFVQKCKEAGGSPATTLPQYRGGEKFECRGAGGTGASTTPSGGCEREAKVNVDWVFTDGGARATYSRARNQGKSAFDSVVSAQGHNQRVQELLRSCRGWVESYLAQRGESGTVPGAPPALGNRKLSAADCRCISVVPNGTGFRVSSTCDAMQVSVLFVEGYMAHGVHTVATSWAQAGIVGTGRDGVVFAPPYKVPSIKAVGLANDANKWTCNF